SARNLAIGRLGEDLPSRAGTSFQDPRRLNRHIREVTAHFRGQLNSERTHGCVLHGRLSNHARTRHVSQEHSESRPGKIAGTSLSSNYFNLRMVTLRNITGSLCPAKPK